jgi:hypothetical protein
LSKIIIIPKRDEDLGGIGEKNIVGLLGLECVDSMQQTIRKHAYSLKNKTFCKRAR